jgi:hypothetical protein
MSVLVHVPLLLFAIERAIRPKFDVKFPAARIQPIGKTLRRHDAAAETYLIVDI